MNKKQDGLNILDSAFITYSGGAVVTKHVINREGRIKWCFRENGCDEVDTGWRFLSEIDTDDYLVDLDHSLVCAIDTVLEIEPIIQSILDLPIGIELELVRSEHGDYFINIQTGEKLNALSERD